MSTKYTNYRFALGFALALSVAACAMDAGQDGTSDHGDQAAQGDEEQSAADEVSGVSQGLTPASGCIDRTYSGRTYRWCSQFVTWQQARDKCRSFGLDLVKIQSGGENNFVKTLGVAWLPRWIGANDIDVEGTWAWSAGNVAFFQGTAFDGAALGGAFENFPSWEPVLGGDSLDCANIRPYTNGEWNTTSCTEYSTFVCEQL